MFECRYCKRSFVRERTLLAHSCAEKRRRTQEGEKGVQIGFQTFLKYFEQTQGSAKLKTYEDFCESKFYEAFVRFGRHCVNIRCVNSSLFAEWLLKEHMSKLDHWTKDSYYDRWLKEYIRKENPKDALERAIKEMSEHSDIQNYFDSVSKSRIVHHIITGRISAWVLFNSYKGQEFLDSLPAEDIELIYPWIDPEFWQRRFKDYFADTEWCKDILKKAGL